MLPTIIDVRFRKFIRWQSAAANARAGRQLMAAFNSRIEAEIGSVGRFMLNRAASALHDILGSHFGDEISGLADALDLDPADVLTANLAYDLGNTVGCSTFVAPCASGPLHARNLDWDFPRQLLRRHTLVARVQQAPCGPYTLITWPGFFGALTGIAPGRFSVTINYVTHAYESGTFAALTRAVSGCWPVPWAVRQVLDECTDFQEAVDHLENVELMTPVLFTVAGTRRNEAVVIERSSDEYVTRSAEEHMLCVTNHYQCDEYEDANVELDDLDTLERLSALETALSRRSRLDAESAVKVLSRDALLRDDTQQQVVMAPRTGELVVRIPGGRSVLVDTVGEA